MSSAYGNLTDFLYASIGIKKVIMSCTSFTSKVTGLFSKFTLKHCLLPIQVESTRTQDLLDTAIQVKRQNIIFMSFSCNPNFKVISMSKVNMPMNPNDLHSKILCERGVFLCRIFLAMIGTRIHTKRTNKGEDKT